MHPSHIYQCEIGALLGSGRIHEPFSRPFLELAEGEPYVDVTDGGPHKALPTSGIVFSWVHLFAGFSRLACGGTRHAWWPVR